MAVRSRARAAESDSDTPHGDATARPTPGREPARPTPRRRRPALIALGVVLFVVSFLGVMAIINATSQTIQVLAVASSVSRGEAITGDDLTTVELPEDHGTLEVLPAGQFDTVVGKFAAVDLVPGTTLTSAAVTDQLTPESGTSIVGLTIPNGQMPSRPLVAGDNVRIVDTPASGGEPPAETPETLEATVISAAPAQDGQTTLVNLMVGEADAPAIAARGATGRIALIIDTPAR